MIPWIQREEPISETIESNRELVSFPNKARLKIFKYLKVPKREKFDRSDFPDFYTMKSLRVGDLGVKIKKNFTNI